MLFNKISNKLADTQIPLLIFSQLLFLTVFWGEGSILPFLLTLTKLGGRVISFLNILLSCKKLAPTRDRWCLVNATDWYVMPPQDLKPLFDLCCYTKLKFSPNLKMWVLPSPEVFWELLGLQKPCLRLWIINYGQIICVLFPNQPWYSRQ